MSPRSDIGSWMKFYPTDWLASVKRLPLAARGAYIDLLAYAWDNELPDDAETLALIVGVGLGEFAPLWDKHLRLKFEVVEGEGRLVNRRQEEIREAQKAIHGARSDAARKRWAGTTPEERSAAMKVVRRAPDEQTTSKGTNKRREDLGLRTQVLGDQDLGCENVRTREDAALSATLGAGLPGWVSAMLREFLDHRLEIAGGARSNLKVPGTAGGWTALGRKVELAGEGVAREALDELLASGWDRLSNAIEAVQERRLKPVGRKAREIDENETEAGAQAQRIIDDLAKYEREGR